MCSIYLHNFYLWLKLVSFDEIHLSPWTVWTLQRSKSISGKASSLQGSLILSPPSTRQEIKLLKGTSFSQTIIFRVHVSFPGSTAFVFEILRMLPSWINMTNSLSQSMEMCKIRLFCIKLIRIIVTSHVLNQIWSYDAPTMVRELLQIRELFLSQIALCFFDTYFVGFGYCKALVGIYACCL